jgi:Flp pilus assembly protein protease CpaA
METRDVANWVVTVLVVAAIVALLVVAQGTPDHSRDRGSGLTAAVTTSVE